MRSKKEARQLIDTSVDHELLVPAKIAKEVFEDDLEDKKRKRGCSGRAGGDPSVSEANTPSVLFLCVVFAQLYVVCMFLL